MTISEKEKHNKCAHIPLDTVFFLLNICEQTSRHVFIYNAIERPLLLHFGAPLLILILFLAHKLLNKADRHFLKTNKKD